MRFGPRMHPTIAAAAAIAAAVAAGVATSRLNLADLGRIGGPDRDQARICSAFAGAFHDRARMTDVRVDALSRTESAGADGGAVAVRYRAGEDGAEHWVACAFRGKPFETGRTEPTAVATDAAGRLSDVEFHLLRIWARLTPASAPAAPLNAAEPAETPPKNAE